MPERQLLQVRPIARDDDMPPTDPRGQFDPHGQNGSGTVKQKDPSTALEEIKRVIGVVYVPRYLPRGFDWIEATAVRTRNVKLHYEGTDELFGHTITVVQFAIPGRPKIRDGFYQEVRVGEYPGYMVRGSWATSVDRMGNLQTKWKTDHVLELMFERDTTWTLIRVWHPGPTPSISESELLKIGASMEAA